MKAIVKVANPSCGMYAAEIDRHGEYVIFELLDSSEPELGDVVSHPDFIERWRATGPGRQTRMAEQLAKGPSRSKGAA